jgi:hypothetical protein
MNWLLTWAVFILVALILGLAGYHFSLRTLRVTTAGAVLAVAGYLTWHGLTYTVKPGGSLSAGFMAGADALSTALFRVLPGRDGWIVIVVLLMIGYRELESWTLHNQARSLDTSALAGGGPDDGPAEAAGHGQDTSHGQDARSDKQRHDRLIAELKFRLPAVQVRSPAILPGGSRAGGLASIAEKSGFPAGGLAGAIINFFGMLWPGPRRVRVQVWVERTLDCPEPDGVARVTVDLDDPRTGQSLATKTLTACCDDHAASVVAGYVARYIFADDRTAPPWCTSAPDGRDLTALLIARQVRDYPESLDRVTAARMKQIGFLEGVAFGSQCAGVTRYELAQLYDLTGEHVEALLIHAINREQYPDFYRGRYRLAMSLEMITNLTSGVTISEAQLPEFRRALKILHACGVLRHDPDEYPRPGPAGLPAGLRVALLTAAWDELHAIRSYLSLPKVLWRSFWHRDERGVLRPYWRHRHRQAFHDGVRAAQLLVGIRLSHLSPGLARRPRRARTILRVAAAITGDSVPLARAVGMGGVRGLKRDAPPLTKSLRTRHWFRPNCTRSWQAGYNLACAYAAVAQDPRTRPAGETALSGLTGRAVKSLWFAVCNPECEMDRPWDWIYNDPDFLFMHLSDTKNGDQTAKDKKGREQEAHDAKAFAAFRDFLGQQEQRDYPSIPLAASCGSTRKSAIAGRQAGLAEAAGPVVDSVEQLGRGDHLKLGA